MSRLYFLLTVLVLTSLLGFGQSKPYPKPQVESAAGKAAPDFTLNDANGKSFKLSDQRGNWVLLYFYRGYW